MERLSSVPKMTPAGWFVCCLAAARCGRDLSAALRARVTVGDERERRWSTSEQGVRVVHPGTAVILDSHTAMHAAAEVSETRGKTSAEKQPKETRSQQTHDEKHSRQHHAMRLFWMHGRERG